MKPDPHFTTWERISGNRARLNSVTNKWNGSNIAKYNYGAYDSNGRITFRQAVPGITWQGMVFDNKGRLTNAQVDTWDPRSYGYDGRNNRTTETGVTIGLAGPDQLGARNSSARGFGVSGTANPNAVVRVSNLYIPGGFADLIPSANGAYFGYWPVPSTTPPANASVLIDATVRGTLKETGKPDKIAESNVLMRVPPVSEALEYDGAGRLKSDGFWTYQWDPLDRLTKMVAKVSSVPDSTEELTFRYDANDRRIWKEHRITPTTGSPTVKTSTMLWAGWLPLCEIRQKDGVNIGRRWFQWGADLSGTLDAAGGIGGLVAIQEEKSEGGWKRTLLPITDGIGNVTAVLDANNGSMVAQYNFGPFGEPINETGEADACPFRWQTKYYDAECQHYYFGYRHYDPRLGRWLSRDPLRERGGFNLYAYCGNDPVNRHDPLGLEDNEWLVRSKEYQAYLGMDAGFFANVGNFSGATWFGIWGAFRQGFTDTKASLPVAAAQLDAVKSQLSNEHPVAAIPIRGMLWLSEGALHMNPMILSSDASLIADNGVWNTLKAAGSKISLDARRIFTEKTWDAFHDTVENTANIFALWKGGRMAVGGLRARFSATKAASTFDDFLGK